MTSPFSPATRRFLRQHRLLVEMTGALAVCTFVMVLGALGIWP